MSRAKLASVALIACLALSAIAASSASAGEWFIGGTKLAAGQTAAVAATASLDKPFFLSAPTVPLLIECQRPAAIFKGALLTAGKIVGESFANDGCVLVVAPPGCSLSSSSVAMKPFEAIVATGTSPVDRITFKAQKEAKRLFELFFTGEACSIEGMQGVVGAVTAKLATGQTESGIQRMEWMGSTENNSLEGALTKVYFESGTTLMKLVSGSKWSFH